MFDRKHSLQRKSKFEKYQDQMEPSFKKSLKIALKEMLDDEIIKAQLSMWITPSHLSTESNEKDTLIKCNAFGTRHSYSQISSRD